MITHCDALVRKIASSKSRQTSAMHEFSVIHKSWGRGQGGRGRDTPEFGVKMTPQKGVFCMGSYMTLLHCGAAHAKICKCFKLNRENRRERRGNACGSRGVRA